MAIKIESLKQLFNGIVNFCQLFTLTGKSIYEANPKRKKFTIDMVHFPSGIYIAQIKNKEKYSILKIIKK